MTGRSGGRCARRRADVHTEIPLLDALLRHHRRAIDRDWLPYRNHAYRVANACIALASAEAQDAVDKIALAAAFHDLGIWTGHTFDYLGPSMDLAAAHLRGSDREPWTEEIVAMVRHHHQISSVEAGGLVEAFRKADWVDVSLGAPIVRCCDVTPVQRHSRRRRPSR